MRPRLLTLIAASMSVAVLSATACQAPGHSTDLKAEIEAVNAQFSSAFAAQDAEAVSKLYTADGWLMASNAPAVKGRAAIVETAKGLFGAGIAGVTLMTNEVRGNDSVAVEVGNFRLTDKAGNTLDEGKYLVWWKRTTDGWKLHRDIFNSDLPVPPPAPAPAPAKKK